MIEDSSGIKHKGRTIRIVLVSLVALLVVGTGVALQPRTGEQPQPSFSETARTSALTDVLTLIDSARRLEAAEGTKELADALELLTNHARALQGPAGLAPVTPSSPAMVTPNSSPAPVTPKRDELLSTLVASSSSRLTAAAGSDGGTARLLAAVGTAQLLEASKLAAAWGLRAPTIAVPAGGVAEASSAQPGDGPRTAERSASAAEAPAAGCPAAESPGTAGPAVATLPGALAEAVRAELEAVYGYQVALKRLEPGQAAAASAYLAKHQEALRQAEAISRLLCVGVPPREAGYRLPATFANAPARALGDLEADVLPLYGDLIALSPTPQGAPSQDPTNPPAASDTRSWAIAMLVSAAQRAQSWAEPVPDFPGIILDTSELPTLQPPAEPPAPSSPGATSQAG